MMRPSVREHMAKLQTLLALTAMVIAPSVANDRFPTAENAANVASRGA